MGNGDTLTYIITVCQTYFDAAVSMYSDAFVSLYFDAAVSFDLTQPLVPHWLQEASLR